jgi:hypothetical protein
MTEATLTYANATSDQQKTIDGAIAYVGTDPEKIVRIGVSEGERMQDILIKISQSDFGAPAAEVAQSIQTFLNESGSSDGVNIKWIQQLRKKLDTAKQDILKNGENIKSFVEAQSAVDQNLQLLLAALNELEHRMMFGAPSADAKYDLGGPDTRGFPVNGDALKKEVQANGSAKALQDATDLLETLCFVKTKGNQLADTLGRHGRDMKLFKEASEENTRNFMSITSLTTEVISDFTAQMALNHMAERPKLKTPCGPGGHKPA